MSKISRRHFFFGSLLAGVIPRVGFGSVPSLKALGYQSPNEKLNIAGIGAGGQALGDLRQHVTENIVALADVDWARGAQGFQAFPKATKYKDFRQMLDKDGKSIDAVVIGIPDHMHATAALACMQLGKGVYVEKPLTRTPWEARLLADAAKKYKVATQMGNQGYSHEATRVAAEIIWSGEIGEVTEVHSFRGPTSWPTGAAMQQVPAPTPVPDTLDWDLWLGGAAMRPFTQGGDAYREAQYGFYLPFNWRGFHDFGTGLIGDWAIHIFGPANLALRLGSPTSVECVKQEGVSPFTFADRQHIRWEFAARGSMPPVTLNWYVNYPGSASSDAYTPPGMTAEDARQIPGTGPTLASAAGRGGGGGGGRAGDPAGRGAAGDPAGRGAAGDPAGRGAAGGGAGRGGGGGGRGGGGTGLPSSGYNQIFVGSKGYLGTSGRGEGVGLLPGKKWADYTLPAQMLTRSPGHHRDWVRACKGGEPACSNFSIAGPYTEWIVLGAIATRVPGKLLWDGAKLEFTNNRDANRYVRPVFRKGWEIRL
jgi:predicted dehydrogenase